MHRENNLSHKIALLATGDEITHGDILNTNSQEIAQRLVNQGMSIGFHMTAPDRVSAIEESIRFLLQSHQAIIITGGLGPTSDDLTRNALANVVKQPLIFDENTWQSIVDRLKKFGYGEPPQSNRQQALFPQQATIIANPHGTAAGCYMQHNQQWIFMLPGPPIECLPMIETTVIPILMKHPFQQIFFRKSWLLFGVSEGQIAEELDTLVKPFDCTTGYRLCYPYLEFKIYSNHEKDFTTLVPLVEKTIRSYLISDGKKTASAILRDKLKTFRLGICDHATGGLLESTLKSPENCANLFFSSLENFSAKIPFVVIEGLDDFWQRKENVTQTNLKIKFSESHSIEKQIPFRGIRVKQYAVEFICHQINAFIFPSLKKEG